MSIIVRKVSTPEELESVFQIRKIVFVVEQNVPENEEYDEYEKIARHFLAYHNGTPCGTARWRFTDKGIKLERFAVLADYRGKNVGKALVSNVLADVRQHENSEGKKIYLHAQVTAMPLYQHFGFQAIGDLFEECNIEHYKMELPMV